MPHPLTPLLVNSGRSTICLIAAGALLWIIGGPGNSGRVALDPIARHDAARAAIDHLADLRTLTERLGTEPASDPAFDTDLKRARRALGADMIALRETVEGSAEQQALGDALAGLARYQAAWTDGRDQVRSGDPVGARQALDGAVPLADRAAVAVASLSHVIDDGNALALAARSAIERAHQIRIAGLALLTAGALLLWAGRRQEAAALVDHTEERGIG